MPSKGYARNPKLAYEVYEMAKLFCQKPSDIAILDDCVGEFGRFWFDRGIAAFGRAVHQRMEQAGQSSNETIARTQRIREWNRLMGEDMSTSAAGYADPSEGLSPHARAHGMADEEDDIVLDDDGGWW
jgi:hypothetical protein